MLDKLFFKQKRDDQIKKLFQELTSAWARIEDLEKSVNDYQRIDEKTVQYQQKKATEFKNKAAQRLEEIEEIIIKLKREADAGMVNARKIDEARQLASEARIKTEMEAETLAEKSANLSAKLTEFETFDENHPNFEIEIERFEEVLTESETQNTKLNQILKNAETRRREIVEKHQEVFGFEQEDDDGETTKQPGLVDELEDAYDELDKKLKTSEEALKISLDAAVKASADSRKLLEDGAKEQLQLRKTEFEATQSKIESLLPAALTVGLSAAYAEKREREKGEKKEHEKAFSNGVWMLIGVSLIPFIVSIVFLIQDKTLEDVVLKLPRLVLSILPLYLPALWITGAAAKRIKLSKRLIEEYAHKETQSRTFEGLASQVNSLGDDEQSLDLKRRLLYNLIQISSENPGKLISDYNSTDHPVTELVDSMERTNMLAERVGNFPLIGKAIKLVQKNQTKQVQRINEEVAETFAKGGLADSTNQENNNSKDNGNT